MTDNLVKRLRAWSSLIEQGAEVPAAALAMLEAADRIEALERERERLMAYEYSAKLHLEQTRREALEEAAVLLGKEAAEYDIWTHALLERLAAAIRTLKEKE